MSIGSRSRVCAFLELGVLYCSFLVAAAQPAAPPDLILYNARVFTSSDEQPWVQALAIRGERILAAGDSAKILALRGPATRAIDLGGRTVIPGINDAHVHLGISPSSGPERGIDLLITVSGTKWMLDGTPLEGTFAGRAARAAIFASDGKVMRGSSGAPLDMKFFDFGMLFPESELVAILRETRSDGDPLLLHISGYPASLAMLKALQANGGSAVWASRRVRFEHGDSLFPDLIPSVKELHIVVVQNPTHLAARDLIPGLVLEEAQPLRSLLNAGIPVALDSDFTVPLPQLPGTKSVLTIVGGKVVYDAKVVSAH